VSRSNGISNTAVSPGQISNIHAMQPAETSSVFIVTHQRVTAALDRLELWMMPQIDGPDNDVFWSARGL
jgi:hypothetical protein